MLASGDDAGALTLWEAASSSSYVKLFSLDGPAVPVVSLALRRGRLVAALASGALRFFCLAQRRPWMQVQAHARLGSCLALHPLRDVFATAAEDATLHVWALPAVDAPTQARRAAPPCGGDQPIAP